MNGEEASNNLPSKAIDLLGFVVRQVVRGATDRWVAIAALLSVTVVGSVFLIRCPSSELNHTSLATLIGAIADLAMASWICVGGWILSALVMFVSFIVISMQHRRIQSQGSQLVRVRRFIDPDRLPAGDLLALQDYSKRTKERFGGRGPSQ